MREQELKAKIKQEFEAETPDLNSKIINSCKSISQEEVATMAAAPQRRTLYPLLKRLSLCAACLLIFVIGISSFIFIRNSQGGDQTPTVDTRIYLDVNPSVELQLDAQGKVIDFIAVNADAGEILEELNLEGNDANTAIKAVVGSMHANGYITAESSSILVSVSAKDTAKGDALLADITNDINEVFADSEIECSIITQNIEVSEELEKRAKENGVSVGKMHLVDKMIEGRDDIDKEEIKNLANMSIKELDKLYSEMNPPKEDPPSEDPPKEDPPSDNPNEKPNRVEDDAQSNALVSMVLEKKEIAAEKVKNSEVYFWFVSYEHQIKPAYVVLLEIDGEEGFFVYDIDLFTGAIFKEQHVGSLEELWKN